MEYYKKEKYRIIFGFTQMDIEKIDIFRPKSCEGYNMESY